MAYTSDDGGYYLVNVNMAKNEIDVRQMTEPDDDHAFRWLWPMGPHGEAVAGFDETYFREYCAEQCVTKYRNGERIVTWEPINQ